MQSKNAVKNSTPLEFIAKNISPKKKFAFVKLAPLIRKSSGVKNLTKIAYTGKYIAVTKSRPLSFEHKATIAAIFSKLYLAAGIGECVSHKRQMSEDGSVVSNFEKIASLRKLVIASLNGQSVNALLLTSATEGKPLLIDCAVTKNPPNGNLLHKYIVITQKATGLISEREGEPNKCL